MILFEIILSHGKEGFNGITAISSTSNMATFFKLPPSNLAVKNQKSQETLLTDTGRSPS